MRLPNDLTKDLKLPEQRCKNCARRLYDGFLIGQIRCPRCVADHTTYLTAETTRVAKPSK